MTQHFLDQAFTEKFDHGFRGKSFALKVIFWIFKNIFYSVHNEKREG